VAPGCRKVVFAAIPRHGSKPKTKWIRPSNSFSNNILQPEQVNRSESKTLPIHSASVEIFAGETSFLSNEKT
jgi:hypothetical protein